MNGLSSVSIARTPALGQVQGLKKPDNSAVITAPASQPVAPSPQESVQFSRSEAAATVVAEGTALPATSKQASAEVYTAPSTLVMEEPQTAAISSPTLEGGQSALATLTEATMAKISSEAHWDSALNAFGDLPEADRAAAGKRAFYTQAASLPEFAETLNGLQPEMRPKFPVLLQNAKEANAIGNIDLDSMVKKWSAENPEQAYIAQMNGFADYAGEQLVNAAIDQGATSLSELKKGPREEALSQVQLHSDGYVRDRGAFFSGAHKLVSDGHQAMAQQLFA